MNYSYRMNQRKILVMQLSNDLVREEKMEEHLVMSAVSFSL